MLSRIESVGFRCHRRIDDGIWPAERSGAVSDRGCRTFLCRHFLFAPVGIRRARIRKSRWMSSVKRGRSIEEEGYRPDARLLRRSFGMRRSSFEKTSLLPSSDHMPWPGMIRLPSSIRPFPTRCRAFVPGRFQSNRRSSRQEDRASPPREVDGVWCRLPSGRDIDVGERSFSRKEIDDGDDDCKG